MREVTAQYRFRGTYPASASENLCAGVQTTVRCYFRIPPELSGIPSPGSVLQKLDHAGTPKHQKHKYVFLITEIDSIASIGELLSITVGHILPGGYNTLDVLKPT